MVHPKTAYLLGFALLLFTGFLTPGHNTLSGQSVNANIKFSNLSIKNGLSQSSANCIFQDSRGIMWIGTEDGLNKYDGYQFTVYKPKQDDAFSISNSRILSIAEDSVGNLWIGTNGGGLNRYDRKADKFYACVPVGKDSMIFVGQVVHTVLQTQGGKLWVGTEAGLVLYDLKTGLFKDLSSEYAELGSITGIPINTLVEDKYNVWIGTAQGLFQFDLTSKALHQYLNNPFDDQSIPNNDITALIAVDENQMIIGTKGGLCTLDPIAGLCTRIPVNSSTGVSEFFGISSLLLDDAGDLWIGTNAHGLFIGSIQTGFFTNHAYDHLNPYSLRNNEVLSLFRDFSGIIWVGTNGIDLYNAKKEKFVLYDYVPFTREQIVFRNIHPIYEDRSGVLWIGSKTDGLHRLDRNNKSYARYIQAPTDGIGLSSSKIRAILEFPEGVLWIGTEDGGLNKVYLDENRRPNRFKHYEYQADNPSSITSNRIYSFYADDKKQLWIGTDRGLTIMNIDDETFTQYLPDNKSGSISNATVYAIYGDRSGNVWLATDLGVNKYDPASDGFIHYKHHPQDENTIIHNEILCFHEDKQGNLWIGTYGKGFDKFNPVTGKFTHFTQSDQLSTAVIYGILEDNQGLLWMSTNSGLLTFDEKAGTLKYFSIEDGLQSNEFNGTSYFESRNGEMFFGGQYGFNGFFPENVKIDSIPPKIILSDLQVLNVSVVSGDHSPISAHINEAKEILLNYKQNNFTLYFSALHFANPALNHYKYKLEGFDKDWIDAGNKRFVSYTNLPYKTYTFRVIASNSDGIWNTKGLAVKIRVKPPFWSTIWFRFLSGILLIGLTIFLIRRRLTKDERQKQLLEQQFEASSKELEEARLQLENQHAEIVIQKRELFQRQKDQENLLWFNQGLGEFSELISRNRENLQILCKEVIEKLVDYVEAQQGGVFLLNDQDESDPCLELVAHYAFSLSRTNLRFAIGEGYVGTCFKDQHFLEIDNLSENYTELQSGLGKMHLKHLICAPLKVNNMCIGVVELGSFKKIKGYRISFVEKLMETFASTLNIEQANNKLKRLIDSSTLQARELAENEEQLRLNLEEIMATQEEASRREDELIILAEESASREEMLNQEINQLKEQLAQLSNQPTPD